MKKKLNKDDFNKFIDYKYNQLISRVERLECELWELKNPPKFKEGTIVKFKDDSEFKILGYRRIEYFDGGGRYVSYYYHTYCAKELPLKLNDNTEACVVIKDTPENPLILQ